MTGAGDKALWAKCSDDDCGHCWAVAYYPMDMLTVCKNMAEHANCPRCGKPGNVAKQSDGELLEEGARQ